MRRAKASTPQRTAQRSTSVTWSPFAIGRRCEHDTAHGHALPEAHDLELADGRAGSDAQPLARAERRFPAST